MRMRHIVICGLSRSTSMQCACALLSSVACPAVPACNAHASYCHLWPAPLYQHAMRMRHIVFCGLPRSTSMQCACAILSSVACPAPHIFSTLSHKRHDFRKQVTEHKMCVLFFYTNLSETCLILRRNERDKNIYWTSCKVPFILVRF